MLAQDFGPVRLILPHVDHAIAWRRFILAINASAAANADAVEAHLTRATWAAVTAAALSADLDGQGRPQTWGDAVRGKVPHEVTQDREAIGAAAAGLRELGASYSDLVNLGDEIVAWLTAQILAPVEAGEKTAGFFARPKAG